MKDEQTRYPLFAWGLLLIITILCCVWSGMGSKVDTGHSYPPLEGPPCIQWNGELYIYGCKKASEVMDIASIGPVVGTVTSMVKPSDVPKVDSQTNSSLFEGVSFAECDNGLVALVDSEWLWLYLYQPEG